MNAEEEKEYFSYTDEDKAFRVVWCGQRKKRSRDVDSSPRCVKSRGENTFKYNHRSQKLLQPSNFKKKSLETSVALSIADSKHGIFARPGTIQVAHDNDTCGICFQNFKDQGLLNCCDHVFCKSCIDKWLKRCCRCPHCKQVVSVVTSSETGAASTVLFRELGETLEVEENEEDEADIHDFMDRVLVYARMAGYRFHYSHRTEFNPETATDNLENEEQSCIGNIASRIHRILDSDASNSSSR